MEKSKLNSPNILQRFSHLEVIQWQWQSDLHPYKEADPSKWIWQDYSDDENLIIEGAYSLNQKTVSLKDHEIDFKKMVQVNVQDKNKVRPVRRQESSRFMMEIPEAKIVMRDQKTINEAFGTVQHFLEYIMKRTPEAYALYQRVKHFSLDCPRNQFEDLVNEVKTCIEKGAEARAKIIKRRTGMRVRDFISEAKKVKVEIENNSSTLGDFLKAILKTYTMETFICYWLNELLRSEDWEEINVLTPYLVCLVYTFKLSDYVLKSKGSQKAVNDKFGFSVKHKLSLYRGAALTEDQLVNYNPNKIKYFSWNGVTSTSRDRNIALKFMDLSVNQTAKIRILFLIEIDCDSLEDYYGMIDISPHSKYPKEQEVILAPGTVFKLLEISLIDDDVYEIHLKVTKNIKETQEDVALLGVLQEKAILKDQALIDGLPSEKGFRTLELLRGNQLIRKLEIRNSGLVEHILEEIKNVRETTHVKKEDIKLVGNMIFVSGLSLLTHYFSTENLNDILMLNNIRFGSEIIEMNSEISPKLQIKNLILTDKTIEMFHNNFQLSSLWDVLKNESEITGISLLIQKVPFTNTELANFFECIKKCRSLENLALELSENQVSVIKNWKSFYQAISSSKSLNQLSLKLPFSDKGLGHLENSFKSLKSLKNLNLDFHGKNQISEEGLDHLKNALILLAPLQHLSLRFGGKNKISDHGLYHLKSAISSLVCLRHLSIELADCSLSDEGLNDLTSGITFLISLQHLHLGLRGCNYVSDFGLKSLKKTFGLLAKLQHLSFDFFACRQISEESFNDLMTTFTISKSLKHFLINIQFHQQTWEKDSNHLKSVLVSLTPLQKVSMTLKFCKFITSQSLHSLKRTLESSSFISDLSFDFRDCQLIIEPGLGLLKEILSGFKSLQRLSLDLANYCETTNEELYYLSSSLILLPYLQHLSLDLGRRVHFSDEGLAYLSTALTSLTLLQHLSINFGYCNTISGEGLAPLKNALKSLTSLQYLSLNLRPSEQILDGRLSDLSSALIPLTSLQDLSLNFENCNKISTFLYSLGKSFTLLTSLEYLSLSFAHSINFSDEGLEYLSNSLIRLTPRGQEISILMS